MMYICLLTGCANGIGLYLTDVLLRKGHCVVATDIDETQLRRAAAERGWPPDRHRLLKLDVTCASDWQQALDEVMSSWGRLDIGMNIAGVIRPGYVAKFPPEDIDFMVDINLKGVMLGTRLMAEAMIPQRFGQIVNIASLAGVAPIEGLAVYSATKAAVRFFSLAAASELNRHRVGVSVVCSDVVDTNMFRQQLPHEAAALTFSGDRILTVEEVCQTILREALERKRAEILIPPGRGWLAKLGNLFPETARHLTERLRKRGNEKRMSLNRDSGD
ncbi:SDR family NAD(P)-dependent oxidoreductase [Tellurirhabdus rosea]|uniref:SDR family NAD(P)-dependent oxidoreductase n=1 Tax=Tellurirhabdus rosea TaxID=2674997 RepID=UPI0022557267|nr:SDR family NAD(P)-dependent oxidoreductase [Tellurirhabdus rosea]